MSSESGALHQKATFMFDIAHGPCTNKEEQ